MIRRLWFDLPATLRLAEHALSRTTFDRGLPGSPAWPCLILTLDGLPRLYGNGLPALRAGNRIDAIHIDTLNPDPNQAAAQPEQDGGAEPVQPSGHRLLPLAGVLFMKLLRDGVAAGDCWLLIDVTAGADMAMHTRAARDTETVPDGVEWYEATVTAGPLGPYPARVARGYRHNGAAIAWFDQFTCARLAADTDPDAGAPTGPVAVRAIGGRVWLVEAPGTTGETAVAVDREPRGWYRITHPALPWTATPASPDGDADAGMFESCEPNGESMRCTVCGAVDEIDHKELPSMVGYGVDTHTACGLCGSVETTDPMFGTRIHRAVWPPVPSGEAVP